MKFLSYIGHEEFDRHRKGSLEAKI